ncbi:MAG: S8 family serine peptidase [Pyrinomonadaceae bacterium]
MIVVKGEQGDVVYVADGDTGAIFYLETPAVAQGLRPYSDFKLLKLTAPEFKKPTGIAYRQGKLIGCDRQANACFEMDLAAGADRTPKAIVSPGLVRAPKHVAVTEAGVLAVASEEQVQYIIPGMSAPRTVVKDVPDIDRIGFDGQTLLVFDEKNGGDLYGFELGGGPESGTESLKDYPKFLPPGTRSRMPQLKDFAHFRGVYYLAGVKEVFVVSRPQPRAPTEPDVLPLPLPADPERDFNRVAVSEENVYISDEGRRVLLTAPRPVPVVVEFPYASNIVADQQVAIIEQLHKKGALLRRTIRARAVYDSVNDFARAELLSNPQPTANWPANSASVTRLASLVCEFNDWKCETTTTPAGARAQAGLVIRKGTKIGEGHEVVVPSASAKGYEVEKVKRENGQFVGLDSLLNERGVIALAAQPSALAPGDIVKIDEDQQAAPTAAGDCDARDAVESSPAVFPSEVRLEPDRFAAQIGSQVTARDLQRLGVVDVTAQYTNMTFDRLNLSVVEKKRACARAAAEPGAYVIDRVLAASSANYTFRDRNGKPFVPDPKRLAALGLPGAADPNNKGGWVLPTRLLLGYRAFGLAPGGAQGDFEVTYLEPIPPTTKFYVQELTLAVEAAKLAGVLQELHNSAAQSRIRFYAFSEQDAAMWGSQKSHGLRAGAPPQEPAALESRATLRRLIHFPEELSKRDLEGIKVGVVEDPATINYQHPSFFKDNGEWSWGDEPPPTKPDLIGQTDFHGTMVASIIGARQGLLGLVPTARLVNINPRELRDEMKDNVKDVQIFNMSLHLSPGEDCKALIQLLSDGTLGRKDLLLVVAAGDDAVDYWEGVESDKPPPVSWLTKLSDNIIVVGTSTTTDIPRLNLNANHAKKYVHLLAPGDTIYAASKKDGYTSDSGSSLAAPQVTAVAALLRGKRLPAPWIKAVLIYTADWYANLSDHAWGGVLNAQRAFDTIANDNPNNIYLPGETGPRFAKLVNKATAKIIVKKGASFDDPNMKRAVRERLRNDKPLFLKDVLRIQRLGGGSYRIIYLDEKATMRVLDEATINGVIRCAVPTDAAGNPITVEGDACADYANGQREGEIPFEIIQDYVGKPLHGLVQVNFPTVVDAP